MANLGFAWRNFLEFFPNIFDPQLVESMDGSSHGCESWTIQKVEPEKFMFLNYGDGEDS